MPENEPVDEVRRRIADFATYCVDSGRGSLRPWLRRPLTAVRVIADARRLPVLDVPLSSSREAELVRRGLTRTRRTFTPVDSLAGVLALPLTLDEYVQTPARRPVRRKVRVAHKAQVTWRLVPDEDERRVLVELAHAREQIHSDEQYRHAVPQLDDLFDVRLWLVAEGPEGPLMLVVIPIDGQWASLRYFRTLAESDAASAARYLMTEVLVGQLIERGVRHLADTESPFVLPNGLRHFQKMVGFDLYRVRVRDAAVAEAPVASPYSVA